MHVAVIGGTGVTGRLVLEGLGRVPGIRRSCLARHGSPDPQVESRTVDVVNDRRAALRALEDVDWAVICTGPFETIRSSVHELCIAAGVHCLDVNDSIDARRDIVRLDGRARSAGVRVLTGCGLCPGLSTMLLCELSDRCAGQARSAVVDLRIGRSQDVGVGALSSMLMSVPGQVRTLRAGREMSIPPRRFRAPGPGAGRMPCPIAYECPDVDIVRRIDPGLGDYLYRICFEQLSARQLGLIQALGALRRPAVARAVARLAAGVTQTRSGGRPRAGGAPTVLTATLRGEDDRCHRARVTGRSSYQLTAACAVAVTAAMTAAGQGTAGRGAEAVPCGVSELDSLRPLHGPLWEALREAGVRRTAEPGTIHDTSRRKDQ